MDEMVALRCKYCGAPLDKKDLEDDSPYVTCPSCGTTQQRVDAKAYLDQLMGQVRSWINQAIPGGAMMTQSENVDSVARYNIFVNNVRPKVDLEYGEYRFALNSLISHSMIVLPFSTDQSLRPGHTSAQAFEFGAKMKEIEPLAVDQDSKSMISGAERASDAYALLINNCKLLQEDKPGRYLLLANNFSAAAKDFSTMDGYQPAQQRFDALSKICLGCDKLLNGDVPSSLGHFGQGLTGLQQAAQGLMGSLKVGIMMQAVDLEIKQTKVMNEIAGFLQGGSDPLKTLAAIRSLFTYQYPSAGNWGYLLNNRDRFSEVFANMSACLAARNGSETVPIAAGGGDYLVPFWYVKLDYSFQTGSLWKKHGVQVSEDLLIPADFVVDAGCLNDPATAVTDVFSSRVQQGMFAGITGSETSISNSQGIGKIAQSAAPNSIGGRKVIVPLSTKREAERLVEQYVQNVAAREAKLKLSNPEVKGLIYIPCNRTGDSYSVPADFGSLTPQRVARTNLPSLVII